jgi:hypothetical protein
MHRLIDRDKYVIDGELALDCLVRYESLHADLALVCAQIGLAWDPGRLPDFKRGIRPPSARASQLFSRRALQLVGDAFAFEIERFGYGVPEIA